MNNSKVEEAVDDKNTIDCITEYPEKLQNLSQANKGIMPYMMESEENPPSVKKDTSKATKR